MALFEKLFGGLGKTKAKLDEQLAEVFDRDRIDDDLYDDLEELLITSDIGVQATQNIIDGLKRDEYYDHIRKPRALGMHMVDKVREAMSTCENDYEFEGRKSVDRRARRAGSGIRCI